MNKSIKIFSLLFVAILCMQSCTNDKLLEDKKVDDIISPVNFIPENCLKTRAALEYNVVNKWVEGDTAGVYAFYTQIALGVPNAKYTFTDGVFFQEFNDPKERIVWDNSLARHTFYMYHPYMNNASNLNNIVFELSNTQTQSEVNKINITQRKSNFLWDAMIGVQRTISGNMKFKMKPLLPICEFLFSKQDNSLDGYCLSKIELKANNLKAGNLNIDFTKITTYGTTGEFAKGLNTSVQSFVLNVPDNAVKMSDYKIGETFSMYLSVNPIESVGNHSVVATFVNPSNKQDVKQITINRTNASFKVENGQGSIIRYLFGSSESANNAIKINYSVTNANDGSVPGFIRLSNGQNVNGSVTEAEGKVVDVQAFANSGYKFVGWYEHNKLLINMTLDEFNNKVTSNATLSITFTKDKEGKTYYAKFLKINNFNISSGNYIWWGKSEAIYIDKQSNEGQFNLEYLDERPYQTYNDGGHQFAKEVFWDNNGPLYQEYANGKLSNNKSTVSNAGVGIWILKKQYRQGAGLGSQAITDRDHKTSPEGWLRLANDYVRLSGRYYFLPSLGLCCIYGGKHKTGLKNERDIVYMHRSSNGSVYTLDGTYDGGRKYTRALLVETALPSVKMGLGNNNWPYAWFTLRRSIAHCPGTGSSGSNGAVYAFKYHDK